MHIGNSEYDISIALTMSSGRLERPDAKETIPISKANGLEKTKKGGDWSRVRDFLAGEKDRDGSSLLSDDARDTRRTAKKNVVFAKEEDHFPHSYSAIWMSRDILRSTEDPWDLTLITSIFLSFRIDKRDKMIYGRRFRKPQRAVHIPSTSLKRDQFLTASNLFLLFNQLTEFEERVTPASVLKMTLTFSLVDERQVGVDIIAVDIYPGSTRVSKTVLDDVLVKARTRSQAYKLLQIQSIECEIHLDMRGDQTTNVLISRKMEVPRLKSFLRTMGYKQVMNRSERKRHVDIQKKEEKHVLQGRDVEVDVNINGTSIDVMSLMTLNLRLQSNSFHRDVSKLVSNDNEPLEVRTLWKSEAVDETGDCEDLRPPGKSILTSNHLSLATSWWEDRIRDSIASKTSVSLRLTTEMPPPIVLFVSPEKNFNRITPFVPTRGTIATDRPAEITFMEYSTRVLDAERRTSLRSSRESFQFYLMAIPSRADRMEQDAESSRVKIEPVDPLAEMSRSCLKFIQNTHKLGIGEFIVGLTIVRITDSEIVRIDTKEGCRRIVETKDYKSLCSSFGGNLEIGNIIHTDDVALDSIDITKTFPKATWWCSRTDGLVLMADELRSIKISDLVEKGMYSTNYPHLDLRVRIQEFPLIETDLKPAPIIRLHSNLDGYDHRPGPTESTEPDPIGGTLISGGILAPGVVHTFGQIGISSVKKLFWFTRIRGNSMSQWFRYVTCNTSPMTRESFDVIDMLRSKYWPLDVTIRLLDAKNEDLLPELTAVQMSPRVRWDPYDQRIVKIDPLYHMINKSFDKVPQTIEFWVQRDTIIMIDWSRVAHRDTIRSHQSHQSAGHYDSSMTRSQILNQDGSSLHLVDTDGTHDLQDHGFIRHIDDDSSTDQTLSLEDTLFQLSTLTCRCCERPMTFTGLSESHAKFCLVVRTTRESRQFPLYNGDQSILKRSGPRSPRVGSSWDTLLFHHILQHRLYRNPMNRRVLNLDVLRFPFPLTVQLHDDDKDRYDNLELLIEERDAGQPYALDLFRNSKLIPGTINQISFTSHKCYCARNGIDLVFEDFVRFLNANGDMLSAIDIMKIASISCSIDIHLSREESDGAMSML